VIPRRGLVLSAPSSGAGKTTITLGLLRALKDRGLDVASAKSGPDYIDPKFHEAATGRPCATLDAWAMRPERLRALVPAAELVVVEGAMGLFDGAPDAENPQGRGSTADVAAALNAPVVLILDCAKQGQSAAAVATGMAAHRADVTVAGVILNRIGSPRHEAMIRRAMGAAGITVFGAVPRDAALALPSRHLGLVQAGEHTALEEFIAGAAQVMADRLDLDALAAAARPLTPPAGQPAAPLPPLGQRIAVARDQAFAFAYAHVLEGWRGRGAELSFFSPLADQAPDQQADAIYLPGGYPELHAGPLAAAERFHAGVRGAAQRGARIYGECGGYMTLGRGLIDADGRRHEMLGLLPLETSFAERRLHLGYRRLTPLPGADWPGAHVAAHEFHYATILGEDGPRLFEAQDSEGNALGAIGLSDGRVAGSFAHIIDLAA